MRFPIISLLCLAVASVSAQGACGDIPGTLASEVTQINNFFNAVPAPVPTSSTNCTAAKRIKSGIDAYRTSQILNPGAGCAGFYGQAVLSNPQFNPAYSRLGQFIAKCP